MNETLQRISAALNPLNFAPVYYGVYTGTDPLTDHIVAVPISVETYEADSQRYYDTNTVQVSIFSTRTVVFAIADSAVVALENAGFFIEQRNYFIDSTTKQHQYDILVTDSNIVL